LLLGWDWKYNVCESKGLIVPIFNSAEIFYDLWPQINWLKYQTFTANPESEGGIKFAVLILFGPFLWLFVELAGVNGARFFDTDL
jgi:hypothetical protein